MSRNPLLLPAAALLAGAGLALRSGSGSPLLAAGLLAAGLALRGRRGAVVCGLALGLLTVWVRSGPALSALDLARFGLLYLREGRWGEEQVVSQSWVRQSVLPYSDAGINGAYGYLWWVARDGIHWPDVIVPPGTYSARGWGGHQLVVMPALDLVLVHRVDTGVKEHEVTSTQFGRLLALLFEAAPSV